MNPASPSLCLLPLLLALLTPVLHADAARAAFRIEPNLLPLLHHALEEADLKYDPAERMVRRPFSSPGYHTALTGGDVHPTRDSLIYAVALLDSGEPARAERARAIIDRVIGLQDQDPSRKTYGIWSWFLEEPLEKMNPPDWNWADFCGVQLLQVALDHRDRLPEDLAARVDAAILHAARSIQRRNVGPGYTNIAIMGTYVTLVAAERYGLSDLRDYALQRLERFAAHTAQHGSFNEYNSPTYTIVALSELGRMRLHVQDPAARAKIEPLYRLAWETIARHFHAPSLQWAGPHSRAYSVLLRTSTLDLLHLSVPGFSDLPTERKRKVHLGLGDQRLPLPCPPDLAPLFLRLAEARSEIVTFQRGEFPIVGTTYLHPLFSLGTINRGDLWNQRRSLLATWGTPDRPSALHLRLLKNGYDLAAGRIWTSQREGRVLAGIALASDGGDTHISITKLKDARLPARELRLRFELHGAAAATALPVLRDSAAPQAGDAAAPARAIRLEFSGLALDIAVLYSKFGDKIGRLESGRDEKAGIAWLDLVLHSGSERTFDLRSLEQAVAGVALQIAPSATEASFAAASATVRDGRLLMHWHDLQLAVPVRPARGSELDRLQAAAVRN